MKKILVALCLLASVRSIHSMKITAKEKPQFKIVIRDYRRIYEEIKRRTSALDRELFDEVKQRGTIETISSLIVKDANIDAIDDHGKTPLKWAAQNGSLEICELLIESGAKVTTVENDLWIAKGLTSKNNGKEKRVLRVIKPERACIPTALTYACENGHLKVCEFLINKKADVNAKTKDGKCPLRAASRNGHFEICELLIESGANENINDKDWKTPLIYAQENNHIKIVELLKDSIAKLLANAECGVCFQKPNQSTPCCFHAMCNTCLEKWDLYSKGCPFCRRVLKK